MTFAATVLTLYPEMFPGPLGQSLAGKALARGDWSCDTIQIRDFTTDKHRAVDDTPAGGGAGMVLKPDVLGRAVDYVLNSQSTRPVHSSAHNLTGHDPGGGGKGADGLASGKNCIPFLAMTPRGIPIQQQRIREIAAGPGVSILCGRFEGFDERLFEAYPQIEQVSLGDIVLSGGEPAALAILDACIRLLPGVMGAPDSGCEESFEEGLLEYPHYTRPGIWEGRTIPEVLRSGDHAKIAAWRRQRSEEDTRLRRPDLWERYGNAPVPSASGAQREKKDSDQ